MPSQASNPDYQAMASGSHSLWARTYFKLKPFIPKSVRWKIRRSRIPRIMRQSADIWPINKSASKKPEGWTGWPHGKKFALVFTHDVESAEGVTKVRNLADLEKNFGFCSSFNFIPEGPYDDPVRLREWLVKNGFEVGVHDLNHDGLLYQSRESFTQKAQTINKYLVKWNSVGFRSGFMLHQLDWLHDLNILYDTSTFDTDPFEPQPDGSATIFPFYVMSSDSNSKLGYIELSYTLPQDSTLFLLLRERTSEIWKRKLAWISEHGGLALVNIHPDYINFGNNIQSSSHYPVAVLEEFLNFIRKDYGDSFWNPLARELAEWYQSNHPNKLVGQK